MRTMTESQNSSQIPVKTKKNVNFKSFLITFKQMFWQVSTSKLEQLPISQSVSGPSQSLLIETTRPGLPNENPTVPYSGPTDLLLSPLQSSGMFKQNLAAVLQHNIEAEFEVRHLK